MFYTPNSEWSLIETTARVPTTHHFPNIAFGLKFRRQSAFLVINILIPIVFLSLINPVVFLLPHESGERVAFSVTILLSFTVFLNVVGGNVPKTSSPLPMLCHYVVIVLITSGIITVLNTLYQRLYHTRGQERIPKRLQRLLCMFSVSKKNAVSNSFEKDYKHEVEIKQTTAPEHLILWKEAAARVDIMSFILFTILAIALAIGYIVSMKNFERDGL